MKFDEGPVPEIRIWFILLTESELKWCIHLHVSRSLFSFFNYLVSVTAGGPKSPQRVLKVATFHGRLRLIRTCSVLRTSKPLVLKLTEFVILWVYYTIPFGFSLSWHSWGIILHSKLLSLSKNH